MDQEMDSAVERQKPRLRTPLDYAAREPGAFCKYIGVFC